MASQKEEPNSAVLFQGTSRDDPFNQLQHQNVVTETMDPEKITSSGTNAVEQPKTVVGDASSLFGNQNSSGNADLFFSSTIATANTTSQSANSTLTTNDASFFDGLGENAAPSLTQSYNHEQQQQQQSTDPAAPSALTQAYDPDSYAYDYNQSQVPHQGEQQHYDQTAYVQFDPNVHYYYDEQGQVHYYDPNTNQEYDMAGYDFSQQSQTYDYQYDPQYAEYYAQQGYDYTAAATDVNPETDQQQQAYGTTGQDNYDPNAYAHQTATSTMDQDYYKATDYSATAQEQQVSYNQSSYNPQVYAASTTDNAVAEVPAQVQSEQTIDTQHYLSEQQQDQHYGIQNYASIDASATEIDPIQQQQQQQQQQEQACNYSSVETATDLQQQQEHAPIDYTHGKYAQFETEFEAEDLQQQQQPFQDESRDIAPPPPSAPLKNAAVSPPKAASTPSSTIAPPPRSNMISPAPDSETRSVTKDDERLKLVDQEQEQDLNDLDDLVLGDASQKQTVSDEFDLLISNTEKPINLTEESQINQDQTVPEQQIKSEPIVLSSDLPETVHISPSEDKTFAPVLNFGSQEQKPESLLIEQSNEPELVVPSNLTIKPQQVEQALSYEPFPHSDQTYEAQNGHGPTFDKEPQQDHEPASGKEPQQALEPTNANGPQQSYEPTSGNQPQQSYEPTSGNQPQQSYEPASGNQLQQSYEPTSGNQPQQSYEPTSGNQPQQSYESTVNYEPQQSYDPAANYAPQQSYESTSGNQPEQNYESPVNYEPQQSYEPTANYEPQQSYEPTVNYEPQQSYETTVNYEPQQSYEPAVNYEPQQSYEPTANYASQQSYDPTASYEPQQSYEPNSGDQLESYEPKSGNDYTTSIGSTPGYETQQNYEATIPEPHQNFAPISNIEPQQSYEPSTHHQSFNPSAAAFSAKSISPSPPTPDFPQQQQRHLPQRANSITEPDRRQHSASPFAAGYYANTGIERSATVPPPITERIASPRPQLIPCPDPQCEGENKAKAKFCCECGRPLAGISRSTTPAANLSPGAYTTMTSLQDGGFNSMAFDGTPMTTMRTVLDDKKDAVVQSLNQFIKSSCVVHSELDIEEKRRRALEYIEHQLNRFSLEHDESQALLWKVVKLMIQHDQNMLGDGGELDKSIIALISTIKADATNNLDKLELFLLQSDRQGACQFAADNDMWAHAFVIASSLETDLFKRMVTQFIHRELFSSNIQLIPQVPGNKKALRTLYSIFNGAGADAVTEFVKNTPEQEEAVYTLQSLEGWKDALALILANRPKKDQDAICGLGDQLKQLNATNEAYLCYLLSPDTLGLGSSKLLDNDAYSNLDNLYLLELYEFALESKATIQQDYKLILAWWLTELGFAEESQKYIDSIVRVLNTTSSTIQTVNQLKQLHSNLSRSTPTESENVTSLLTDQSFDALMNTIQEKVNTQTNTGYDQTADYTGQQHEGHSYGYEADYTTEVSDANAGIISPFAASKGIQSPFQAVSKPMHAVSSPFGAAQSPQAAVKSPFGVAQQTDSSSYIPGSGGWWGSDDQNDQTQPLYQPEIQTTTNTYQPDAYTPAGTEAADKLSSGTRAAWDDDDDLGFGNSKKKSTTEIDHSDNNNTKVTDSTQDQKPNEVSKEETKDKAQSEKAGGWGIFSLFGRKEKDHITEEKKAVKANLGEQSSFYYDEKEKRWVNKLNDTKPAAATPPPPPRSATSQPPTATPMVPPMDGLKPTSMPPPRVNSAPVAPTAGGPPTAAPPGFNTPPVSNRKGGKKPMRSRYVDVLNTN